MIISVPYSKPGETIAKKLATVGVRVAMTAGKKIGDMVKNANNGKKTSEEKSVVYEIPCSGCSQTYVGETGRGVEIRKKEHQRDVKNHSISSAIVLHISKCNNLPIWSETKILEKGMKKQTRKFLEAAHIANRDTFNSRIGFVTYAMPAAKLTARA